ncbi:MAG: ABC transporter ATP-binding protein [Planctomycetota bacterium]
MSGSRAPVIDVRDLRKTFPARKNRPQRNALDGVSFAIEPGELVGVLGANGSGKSTLFRILATLLQPTTGHASIAGHNVAQHPGRARQAMGVVLQAGGIDARLTVAEHLRLFATLKGLRGRAAQDAVATALRNAGLDDRASDAAGELSGGLARRLELAAAGLANPAVLLLDEAAVGLDADARADWWRGLRQRAQEHAAAVLATTHQLDEADRCDRLIVMDRGRVAAQGPPGKLRAGLGEQVLRVRPARAETGHVKQTLTRVAAEQGAEPPAPDDTGWVIAGERAASLIEPASQTLGAGAAEFILGPPTLEDLVRSVTAEHAQPA